MEIEIILIISHVLRLFISFIAFYTKGEGKKYFLESLQKSLSVSYHGYHSFFFFKKKQQSSYFLNGIYFYLVLKKFNACQNSLTK